jgi:hypothetical protein
MNSSNKLKILKILSRVFKVGILAGFIIPTYPPSTSS